MTDYKYVLIGGGVASAQAAVGIREHDKDGAAVILCGERWWPYDRPPLSKGMLLGKASPEDAESKDPSWYEANNVEVRRGVHAKAIDRSERMVHLDDGSSISYQKLLLATGASPRQLSVPGANLDGVHVLRTVDDSLAIRDQLVGAKRALMVGAGYIGLEIASACLASNVPITLAHLGPWPWSDFVGRETGEFLRAYFESKGAEFSLNDTVAKFEGASRLSAAQLESGKYVDADLAVVGIGVTLNTDLARHSGLALDDEHGVLVDATLQTVDPHVYAAGDIAAFEDKSIGRRWHAEHYLNAKWQGNRAGRNMAGASEPYDRVPYFFSDFLDLHIALRGDPGAGKPARVLGSVADAEFVELYARDDGSLAMGLGVSRDEPKLDKISDQLEAHVRERTPVGAITVELG